MIFHCDSIDKKKNKYGHWFVVFRCKKGSSRANTEQPTITICDFSLSAASPEQLTRLWTLWTRNSKRVECCWYKMLQLCELELSRHTATGTEISSLWLCWFGHHLLQMSELKIRGGELMILRDFLWTLDMNSWLISVNYRAWKILEEKNCKKLLEKRIWKFPIRWS